MSAAARNPWGWEYRRLVVIPRQGEDDELSWSSDAARFVENLIEKVENLDRSDEGGWNLLRVRIEEDAQGRCRLNALMKRPRFVGDRQRPATARPQELSTAEIPDKPPSRLPLPKAA